MVELTSYKRNPYQHINETIKSQLNFFIGIISWILNKHNKRFSDF